jgi:hypothetical protein
VRLPPVAADHTSDWTPNRSLHVQSTVAPRSSKDYPDKSSCGRSFALSTKRHPASEDLPAGYTSLEEHPNRKLRRQQEGQNRSLMRVDDLCRLWKRRTSLPRLPGNA